MPDAYPTPPPHTQHTWFYTFEKKAAKKKDKQMVVLRHFFVAEVSRRLNCEQKNISTKKLNTCLPYVPNYYEVQLRRSRLKNRKSKFQGFFKTK